LQTSTNFYGMVLTYTLSLTLLANNSLQQLPEIFTLTGSSPITPETLSGNSVFTGKRKFSESIDLEQGDTLQRRTRRLTGISSRNPANEYTQRPVSWHDNLTDCLPQKNEWEARSALPIGHCASETGTRLPGIKAWQNPLRVPGSQYPVVHSTGAELHRGDIKSPFQSGGPLARLSQVAYSDAPSRPDSAPTNLALPSPGLVRSRTKLLDPWLPHPAPEYPAFDLSLHSPRSDLGVHSMSHNLHSRLDRQSPERQWPQRERIGIQSESSQHGLHIGESTSDLFGKVATTGLEHKRTDSSISPVRINNGNSLDISSGLDAQNFTLPEHTSPTEQYNWEASDAVAEGGNRRRRGNLPKESTAVLNTWFCQHVTYPYPKEDEKHRLQTETGLSMSQVRSQRTSANNCAC